MALYRLFVDSSNGVDIDPEYNFKDSEKKVESKHRTRSGRRYVYKWGDYRKISFGVSYVNSSFKAVVNSWWVSNTELLFKSTSETQVYSVRIVNNTRPVDKVVKPYTDLFKGDIKLETY